MDISKKKKQYWGFDNNNWPCNFVTAAASQSQTQNWLERRHGAPLDQREQPYSHQQRPVREQVLYLFFFLRGLIFQRGLQYFCVIVIKRGFSLRTHKLSASINNLSGNQCCLFSTLDQFVIELFTFFSLMYWIKIQC